MSVVKLKGESKVYSTEINEIKNNVIIMSFTRGLYA